MSLHNERFETQETCEIYKDLHRNEKFSISLITVAKGFTP